MSLLLACGDDDSGSGYADLSTASIADAAIIYQRTGMTRAANGGEEDEGYWKIDRQGNETKILLYDKAGNPTDVKIEKIEKLNDKLLLIETQYYSRMIADLQTEKLYQAPDVFDTPVKEGPDGMLYFASTRDFMLYRLNPTNFTVEQVLPDGQKCLNFLVAKNQTVYYTNNESLLQSSGKLKTPGGRIYPIIPDGIFLMNGEIHTFYFRPDFDHLDVTRWDMKSASELAEVSVFQCDLPQASTRRNTGIAKNEKNGNMLLFLTSGSGNGPEDCNLYEFDGTQFVQAKTFAPDTALGFWEDMRNRESLSEGNLYFSGNAIITLDLNDYSLKSTPYRFPDSEYELYTTTMDEANSRQLFTALRYEDGKVVIGEISAQGRISIISEKESNSKIINLIALN